MAPFQYWLCGLNFHIDSQFPYKFAYTMYYIILYADQRTWTCDDTRRYISGSSLMFSLRTRGIIVIGVGVSHLRAFLKSYQDK